MICPNCKNEIPDSIPFCPICGHEVSETDESDVRNEDKTAVINDYIQNEENMTAEGQTIHHPKNEENYQKPSEADDGSITTDSEKESVVNNKGIDENLTEEEKKSILNKVNGSGYTETMYAAQKPVPGKLPETTYVKILKGFAALAGIFAMSLVALYFI